MLKINTKTTGFGSPADGYAESRLDLNNLVIDDPHTTYYFRYSGESKFNIKSGDILVVDKSKDPEIDDLVIFTRDGKIVLDKLTSKEQEIWGTVTWTLSQIKK